MSLDIYLNSPDKQAKVCNHCDSTYYETEEYFSCNITHNLGQMAGKAGIYDHLWRPETLGITTASQLIEPLTTAIQHMKDRPEYYKQFDSENGWGTYKDFLPWLIKLVEECKCYPEAVIYVSR